jgi:hypothetical protein
VKRLVLLLLVVACLASCGRPSGPVEVDPGLVPFEIGRSPTPAPGASIRTITIYLVRDGRLEPVTRTLSSDAPDAEVAIAALLDGPSSDERDAGLGSAIPPVARFLSVNVVDGVATVDLAEEFQGPATPDEVLLRVAQVVWTLSELSEVAAVRFAVEGAPIAVPTQAVPTVDRPVTVADYAMLAGGGGTGSPTAPGVSEP